MTLDRGTPYRTLDGAITHPAEKRGTRGKLVLDRGTPCRTLDRAMTHPAEKRGTRGKQVLGGCWFTAMSSSFSPQRRACSASCSRCLPDLLPTLGVNPCETVQVRQVSRGDRDGIPWQAGKRRWAGKDGIGIECVGRCRGDAQLRAARRPRELELWPRGFSRQFRGCPLGGMRCSAARTLLCMRHECTTRITTDRQPHRGSGERACREAPPQARC